jgi:hypothetical protein
MISVDFIVFCQLFDLLSLQYVSPIELHVFFPLSLLLKAPPPKPKVTVLACAKRPRKATDPWDSDYKGDQDVC